MVKTTANAFEDEQAKALTVGCNDFVRYLFVEQEIGTKLSQDLMLHFQCKDKISQASGWAPANMR